MIQLTPEQQQAAASGQPVRVVDPATQTVYVLLPLERYERLANGSHASERTLEVTPAFRHAQEAFWRDLPALLADPRQQGKWVAYHGDERIGIAADDAELIAECQRRGLHATNYYLDAGQL